MKLRNWLIMSGIVIAWITILVAACDMSSMLGLTEDEDSGSESFPSLINEFRIEASKNEGLSSDAVGVISGRDIFITLPYDLIASNAVLDPTISVPDYISLSPEGPVIMSNDPEYELVNSKAAGGDRTVYTVRASVDTHSLTVVSVANAFWRDAQGNEHDLPGAEIEKVDGGFIVKTDYSTYQELEGKTIGFRDVNYAPGTSGENLLRPLAGATMPYEITVVSADGTGVKEYSFLQGFQTEEGADILVFADARPVMESDLIRRIDLSTWDSFTTLSAFVNGHGQYPITLAWSGNHSGMAPDGAASAILASTNPSKPPTSSCGRHRWSTYSVSDDKYLTGGYSSAQRQVIRPDSDVYSDITTRDGTVADGPLVLGDVRSIQVSASWENSGFDITAPANQEVNQTQEAFTFGFTIRELFQRNVRRNVTECRENNHEDQNFRDAPKDKTGSAWVQANATPQQFTTTTWDEQEFFPKDFWVIDSLVVEASLGATITDIQLFGIGSSFEINPGGASATITLQDSGMERTVGFVGLVEVESQSGDREMHILNIL